jgi:hypothetical protein
MMSKFIPTVDTDGCVTYINIEQIVSVRRGSNNRDTRAYNLSVLTTVSNDRISVNETLEDLMKEIERAQDA